MDKRLKNKKWRMSNLYKIIDKDGNKITFRPNKAQQHFEENRADRNIILKSRQLGFTTYEAIDMLDDTLFKPNQQNLFIAHTKDDAVEIFDKKIIFAWQNFNEQLRTLWKAESDSAYKLKFGFGKGNSSTLMVRNSGRSATNNRVHISELAKLCIKYPMRGDEIVSGTIPSVPSGGRLDIEGTAEGMFGHFADIFWDAWKNPNIKHSKQFKAHFYNWMWDEEDMERVVSRIIPFEDMEEEHKFREYAGLHGLTPKQVTYYYLCWIACKKDWDTLHQEYPTTPEEAFVFSGSPFFNQEKVMKHITKAPDPVVKGDISLSGTKEPVFEENPEGEFYIWEHPKMYKSYVVGGDVAEGIEGGDYSTLEVIDNQTMKCVAKFRGRIPPDEFSTICFAVGVWYNKAYMGIEANKDGLWVNTELYKMGYPNLYFREAIDDITNRVTSKVGFKTTGQNRPLILAELKRMLYNYDVWTNKDFLRECQSFIRNKVGRPEAMAGKHDDEIMATAIAYEIRRNAPQEFDKPEVKNTNEMMVLARLEKLYGKKNKSKISQEDYM